MAYSRFYSQWKDWPDTSTPIVAAVLQGIEDFLVGVVAANLDGGSALTTYLVSQRIDGGTA